MIDHISKGRGFGCVCKYIEQKEGAQMIDSNMVATDPQSRAREFAAIAAQNARCARPVCHISLSAPEGERLTDDEWRVFGLDYLKRMGFQNCQYSMTRHVDTRHDHVHIVANRVRETDFGVVKDGHDHARSTAILRAMEKEYSLAITREMSTERGYAADLRRDINASVRDAGGDWQKFKAACESRGVAVIENRMSATGI